MIGLFVLYGGHKLTNRAELEAKLKEAESAYHDMMTHGAVRVLVDQNGERVEYTTSNPSRLKGYIASLKKELGIDVKSCGPLGFYF